MAFFSTFFTALSNGQANIKSYYFAKWFANIAMYLAFEPYSYTMAHAVIAKAEHLKRNDEGVLKNIEFSLSYIEKSTEIQEFTEIVKIKNELLELKQKIK